MKHKITYNNKEIEFDTFVIGNAFNDDGSISRNAVKVHINNTEGIWAWVQDKDVEKFDADSSDILIVALLNSSIWGYRWGTALPVMFNEETSMWEYNYKLLGKDSSFVEMPDEEGKEPICFGRHVIVEKISDDTVQVAKSDGSTIDFSVNEIIELADRVNEMREKDEI